MDFLKIGFCLRELNALFSPSFLKFNIVNFLMNFDTPVDCGHLCCTGRLPCPRVGYVFMLDARNYLLSSGMFGKLLELILFYLSFIRVLILFIRCSFASICRCIRDCVVKFAWTVKFQNFY